MVAKKLRFFGKKRLWMPKISFFASKFFLEKAKMAYFSPQF